MKTAATLARMVFALALFGMLMLPFSASSETSGLALPEKEDCLPKDPPPPVVKIKVRVPACAEPGRFIEYRICVENCSTSEAHHVVVKDALPANVKFVKSDPAPSAKEPELQWKLGTIGGGGVREIVLVVQPTDKEDVKNCVRVQFEHGQCVVTRQAALPPGSRPPIISTVPDTIHPDDMPVFDLVITGPKTQYANLPSKYEISLTNKGKTKALNTQVHVRIPDKLKFVKASDSGVAVENVVAWNLGHLEPGKTRILELTMRALAKGELCFKATAEADMGVKKEAEFCTKFVGASAMTVEMTGKDGAVFVGNKTSYPVVIRNQGSEPVTNLLLWAFIPDELKLVRANAAFDQEVPIKGGQWIKFKKLPAIEVGSQASYEIFVEALKVGVTRFHIEVRADQLDSGPVVEQEITNIVDDRDKLK
jgi:uncharacterized repeat protein (TIGR01451 family)